MKFELDRSGLLRVTVTEMGSGKQTSRVLHKQAKTRLQRSSLSDLEAVRIATESKPVDSEEAMAEETAMDFSHLPSFGMTEEEEGEIEISKYQTDVADVAAFAQDMTKEFMQRAGALLESKTLNEGDHAELTQVLAGVQAGDEAAKQRLEDLLYYLE